MSDNRKYYYLKLKENFYNSETMVILESSLNVFNHRTNVDINNRIVCFDIKELGKQLKSLGMLVIQDQVWNRVSQNRDQGKSTWYFVDEFHLLLRGEVGSWSVEIWKRFRKWGGIPTGITQNIKDLLSSPEIENIFENSDFVYLLNQASGDRKILCERLNISNQQAAHISNAGPGEGLIFFGNVILPFVDHFPQDNELYSIMTTTRLVKPGKEARRMNDEKYVIGSGSFRLLIGDLYDLYCYHFSLTRRLAEAADEKALLKIQKSVSGYERRMKRLCRRWGLPTDDTPWAYDTMEKSIRERMLHE